MPLIGFWTYGLFDLDEGIYAASLREMMETGDPFVITFDGAPFLEKPILIYWTGWLASQLGLTGELGLRIPSVLATIGTLCIASRFARREFGDEAARWTLIVLGCSVVFMGVGRMFMPDAMYVFALTAALTLAWESREHRPRAEWAVGALLGVAVLGKGPVAFAIFSLVLLYCVAWLRICRFSRSVLGHLSSD
jgi:4-amino-4-deoxy-L-arabinose transferase-like glycosyltransferase